MKTPSRDDVPHPRGAAHGDPDHVVLLDEAGRPVGTAPRLEVHGAETPLHLAFSTYLFNADGRVLLTRRGLGKRTWAGVWTNSCCGHPRPGEGVEQAARRRIREELGLSVGPLYSVLPEFRYRAVDASGVVENEICPVYVGFVTEDHVTPDPDEVAEWEWVDWPGLVASVQATPRVFSPWSVLQVPQVAQKFPHRLAALGASPVGTDVSLDAALADVDDLLRSELDRLGSDWGRHTQGMGVDVLPADLPGWLADLLLGRGKRLRTAMAFWGYVAAGGTGDSAGYPHMIRLGAALETLHLFALVHDDVMDESDSRRGRPAAHMQARSWHAAASGLGGADRFGENLAILVGDLAHTLADRLVDGLPGQLRALWYDLCVELIAGQRADLTGAAAGRRDLAHAENVSRLKSGAYTIERPLDIGAAAAHGTPVAREALRRAGRHIGRAFALRDDILGVWGDPALTGKPAGDDLAEAKPTVIMALGRERLSGDAADALARLGSPAQRPDDVAFVARALEQSAVRDLVEGFVTAEVDAALRVLQDAPLAHAGVEGLAQAARDVAWRDA